MTTPAPPPSASTDTAPELLDIPVAVLAFGVSLLSFAIALVALAWQVAKHFLDGGRVKVYLNIAIWEPEVRLGTRTDGMFGWPQDESARTVTHGNALEVAQLVVENPGRVPITIYSPGLSITGHGKKNHSISPRLFSTGDHFGPDTAATDRSVRLEPYARTTFLLDYWSVVPSLMEDATVGRVVLRGRVGVAGRTNKPQMSPWRRRWQIKRGVYTAIENSPEFTAYAVLWRQLYVCLPESDDDADRHPNSGPPTTRGMAQFILNEAMSRFETRPPLDDLKEAVEEIAKEHGDRFPIVGIGLYKGYQALDRMEGHLKPWTEGLTFRIIAKDREASEELRQVDAVQADRAAAVAADELSVPGSDGPADHDGATEAPAEHADGRTS